ncbi:MAG: hypothetical protein A2W19_03725, partial [Spirochaetes bacterium RBG_16_49_21]
ADGSYTLYAAAYDEHMHSLSGAYEEALLKHVYPSGVLNSPQKHLYVLDVGFGLGYNILALMAECAKRRYGGSLSIYSLEKERSLITALNQISFNDERDELYSLIKRAYARGYAHGDRVSIKIELGDARNTVQKLSGMLFDAVFIDPFSPSKNPELWSVEFLKELFHLTSDAGILTTYSSAPQIRRALLEAGFNIGRGPSVGGKREGTLASKGAGIQPLDSGELKELRENLKSTPYRDYRLTDAPQTILMQRRHEMRKKRLAEF